MEIRLKMKKIISIFLMFILVFTMGLNVYASEDIEGNVVDNSVLTREKSAEYLYINPQRGNILNRAAAKITNNENGSVNVFGAVYGSCVCDEMILKMTLQRLVNGNWQNVKTFSDTNQNSPHLIKSYNVSVTRGYYYRVKAACVARKGGTSESHAPVTDGIFIE